jgi:hypothetical protein
MQRGVGARRRWAAHAFAAAGQATAVVQGLRQERTASALDMIEYSRAAANGTIRLSGVASMKQ